MNLKELKIETINENVIREIVHAVALNFEEILGDMDQIKKRMASFHIDQQLFVPSNPSVTPGIGCKVAYDKNGLILKSMALESSDLPQLSIQKIDGLQEALSKKLSSMDIHGIINSYESHFLTSQDIESGYGISLNKNDKTIRIEIDLKASDIPQISLDHIKGLRERLDVMEASMTHPCPTTIEDDFKIKPGTFPKVTYDEKGRIVSGSQLSMNDLPNELFCKITAIENEMPLLASQKTLDAIHKDLKKKMEQMIALPSGVYTKLKVDERGKVSKERLTIQDLPKLSIMDIEGLDVALRNKVDYDSYIDLHNTVASFTNSMQKFHDVLNIKSDLQKKANEKEVKELYGKVNHLEELLSTLYEKIPNELIMEQLGEIQKELSNISGRISVLETKFL